MAHEHKTAGPCVPCAVKHLGAAKIRLSEAIASSDLERKKMRLLDVTFELNEAETTHLSDKPEIAQEIRTLRKKIEEVAFGYSDSLTVGPSDVNDIIDKLMKMENVPRGTITPESVLQAIRHYETEYKAPASISDIQFVLTIPPGSPVDREIDEQLKKAPAEEIQKTVARLLEERRVKTTEFGGYANPDFAEGFNIPKPSKNVKMALTSTKDVANVVGSSFVAKFAEAGLKAADVQFNLNTQPPHARISTWAAPIGGALLVLYGWYRARRGRGDDVELAATVAGAHLLTETVDTAEESLTPGSRGFFIRSYQPPAPSPETTSNVPLF